MRTGNSTVSTSLSLGAWIRLLKAHNLIIRRARLGMGNQCTISQFDVLAQLSREKNGTKLVDLSRRLLVTAGNVTGLIDRMESLDLVFRSPDENDRRVTRVHLTEKGKRLGKSMIPIHARDVDQLFAHLNSNEKLQLRRLLDKLIKGLEK